MKGLSNELNFMIDLCLTDSVESANYRLVSKQFACIGEEVHFKIFRFGNTCNEKKTFTRSGALRATPFVEHVKGLEYDEQLVLSQEDRNVRDVVVKHLIRDLWKAEARFETVKLRGIGDKFFTIPCTVIAQDIASGQTRVPLSTFCATARRH